MEAHLNFTGHALQFGNVLQGKLYKSVQYSNTVLVRFASPVIAGASLLIGVMARVANFVESIFKGLANTILGAAYLDGGKIWQGVCQLLKTPLKALEIPLLEVFEASFGTIGLLIDPRKTARFFEDHHNDRADTLENVKNGFISSRTELPILFIYR